MNVTASEAKQIALNYLRQLEPAVGCDLLLIDDHTIERSFGWVYFYTSKRYAETGEIIYALAGNAPIVVTKADGRLHVTGTAYPVEHYLQAFNDYEPPL
jgi:hypothetical protein